MCLSSLCYSAMWLLATSVFAVRVSDLCWSYVFWNPWNYWCSEGTCNHQRVSTVMSQIRRDIKPLLQHNSRNNLRFVPWLWSVDTVYVDGSIRFFNLVYWILVRGTPLFYFCSFLFLFIHERPHSISRPSGCFRIRSELYGSLLAKDPLEFSLWIPLCQFAAWG